MDFFVKYNFKSTEELRIKYCDNINSQKYEDNIIYIEKLNHLDYIELVNKIHRQIAIGDVIRNGAKRDDLSNCKGLFYLLTYTEHDHTLQIDPDDQGLLPIYYIEQHELCYVSSSFFALASELRTKTVNTDFYTELAILFTQLNKDTYFKEIKRLDYGEIIQLNKAFHVKRTKRFFDYFCISPKSFKSSLNEITDHFIDISKWYVQDPCAISLTGGFDGRTITGCAHYHHSDFINFSYGRKGNGDVDNPILISNKLCLKYKLIELERVYLESEYNNCVNLYIKYSGGLNGFQYPQSLYYAKVIGSEKNIIVTGYLGSEVLANAKSSDDEINAQSVLDFLKTGSNKNNYAYTLCEILRQLGLIQNIKDITITLEKLESYFFSLPIDLTMNQKFAVFSFENTYRNTFGVWIYNAMHYAKIRVPFIDKGFLLALSKTRVSQFYRPFLENNPMKRAYGQMFYSVILNKVWPELNAINSSKNYPPKHILTQRGRLKIAINRFIKINESSEMHGLDKLSTISGVISLLEKRVSSDASHQIKNEMIIRLMHENSLYRSLCFLSLSKVESVGILSP